jgi:hypothetical protein
MHKFFSENLRNPARSRRAGLMRQFRTGQVYSTVRPYTAVPRQLSAIPIRFLLGRLLTDIGRIHGSMGLSNIGQVVTSRGGLWVFEHVLGELNFR